MAFVVTIGAIILFVFIGMKLTKGKTRKRKCIVWGLFIMLGFNPLLSFLISIPVGIAEEEGFAAVAMMMLLLPIFFVIGFITLLTGILSKENSAK